MIAVLLALASLAAAPAPPAAPANMAPAFTGTIVSTYPDGLHGRLYLAQDGGWRGVSRHGNASRGRWSVRGERLCLRQQRPIPLPFSYCTPLVTGAVGTTWRAKAPTGEPISVTLQPGREGEPR